MLCRTRSRAHSLELHFLQNRVDPTQSMGWSWPLAGLWEAQVKQSINCLLSPCECLLLWINPMQFFSRQSSQSQMISWQWQRIKAVSKLLGNSNTSKKYRKLKIHDLLYFNGDNQKKTNKQTTCRHTGAERPGWQKCIKIVFPHIMIWVKKCLMYIGKLLRLISNHCCLKLAICQMTCLTLTTDTDWRWTIFRHWLCKSFELTIRIHKLNKIILSINQYVWF